MANIREAFEYASKNPNSDFAKNLEKMAASGSLNLEAKKYGLDLSPFQQAPVVEQPKEDTRSTYQKAIGINEPEAVRNKRNEKILDFTGGKEIAQGLGQALAQPAISKSLDETQQTQQNTQNNLVKKIQEYKKLGKDTSRLDMALSVIQNDIYNTGQGAEKLLNPNELTNKQVIGDALQLATTAGGAKVAGAVAGRATSATGIAKGIIQGASTGAVSGTALGGLTGVSQGLQEDLSAKDILKKGGSGAIAGAITGGVLGGITGGISGGIKQAKISKQDAYLKAITPDTKDLTPTEYEDLLNRGKIKPKTSTSPAQYILSDEEKAIAKKYKGIFSSNDPVKNTESIIDEISKKDKEVGTFLKKNNGIFNTGELKNNLTKKLEGIDDLTIDEKRLLKLKKSTIDNFVKGLKKNDMETLWTARKEFDKTIEKAFSGSPTLQNTIKKEFRNGIQDFIAERTPDGVYKTSMKEMSQLFNLKDIVNTKAVKEKGLNAIQLWVKRNPTKTKVIGTVAGGGAITAIGSSLLKN